jgi:glycosyltransferase involved in cell wall biosynthesis
LLLGEKSLDRHFPSSGDFSKQYRAANRLNGKKTILVIDSSLPYYDKESGGHRIYSILKILRNQNYNLMFLPTNEIADEPYASDLSSLGVELLVDESRENGYQKLLHERLDLIDFAWICRPQMFDQFGKFLEKKSNAKIIYDTIDLHHLRLKRKWILNGGNDRKLEKKWKQFYKKEKKFSKQSDITLTVTQDEAKVVERWDVKRVFVLPNIHVPRGGQIPPFSGRGGLLFIGSYLHPPNVDAVKFLVNEILPIVWRKFPQMQVTLLGSNPNNDVLDLSTDRVKVTGFIEDVVPYFDLAQIFVSPLRYGAGMKGKIGQSMSLGLPVVTTTIGAEGMFLENEKNALISDNPLEISENILRLGSDEELWTRLSMEGVKLMNRFSPKVISLQLEKMFVSK